MQWLINTYAKERTCALPHFAHTIARDEFNQFIYRCDELDIHCWPAMQAADCITYE